MGKLCTGETHASAAVQSHWARRTQWRATTDYEQVTVATRSSLVYREQSQGQTHVINYATQRSTACRVQFGTHALDMAKQAECDKLAEAMTVRANELYATMESYTPDADACRTSAIRLMFNLAVGEIGHHTRAHLLGLAHCGRSDVNARVADIIDKGMGDAGYREVIASNKQWIDTVAWPLLGARDRFLVLCTAHRSIAKPAFAVLRGVGPLGYSNAQPV
jgi:hypothetical protein